MGQLSANKKGADILVYPINEGLLFNVLLCNQTTTYSSFPLCDKQAKR